LSIHQFNVTYESFQDFKKRQALNECFKSLRKKQEVLFIKIFTYREHVIQEDQKTEMKIYMNIDVKMNMISQRFIIEQSMFFFFLNSYTLVTLIRSTHEKLYAICIEWTKLSEVENHLQSTRLLHAVKTVSFETMYQICSRWLHVREWVF